MKVIEQHYEVVPIESIEPHPENPNVGAREIIDESIEENGFYGACIIQASTRRIIAGRHRWDVARSKGATELPVIILDVDDDRAKRIMTVDNESNRRGRYDDQALVDLLSSLESLDGTGFDQTDVETLLAQVAEAEFAPGSQSDQPPLDRRKAVTCPHCGREFEPS